SERDRWRLRSHGDRRSDPAAQLAAHAHVARRIGLDLAEPELADDAGQLSHRLEIYRRVHLGLARGGGEWFALVALLLRPVHVRFRSSQRSASSDGAVTLTR